MRSTVSLAVLVATLVAGQDLATVTNPDPDSAVSTSAPALTVPPPPPRQDFPFLSPMIDFQPAGLWVTSNLAASTNFTEGNAGPSNVTVAAPGSGITFNARTTSGAQPLRVLVNGTDSTQLNASLFGENVATNITNVSAEVSGLTYGYYVFTLASDGGDVTYNTAIPITDGARWEVNPPVHANPAGPAERANIGNASEVQANGNWTRDNNWLSTSTPGATLDITVPPAIALLEITVDAPTTPFAPWNVSISPPPPYDPAEQTFTPTLRPDWIQAAIAQIGVPVYSVLLDPNMDYKVTIAYTGENGITWTAAGINFFAVKPASIQNGTVSGNPGGAGGNGTETGTGTQSGTQQGASLNTSQTSSGSNVSPTAIGANSSTTPGNAATSAAATTWCLPAALLAGFMLL